MTDFNPITKEGATPTVKGQTSGKVIHARPHHMNDAGNVESTKDLPKQR